MATLSLEDLLDHLERRALQLQQEISATEAENADLEKQLKMINDRIAAIKKGSNGKAAPPNKDSGE